MATTVYEDDRPRRRSLTCTLAGAGMGAGLGVLAGIFVRPAAILFAVVGLVAGAVAGRMAAPHVSEDEWDPTIPWRPNVGASSPDDDTVTD
jgi:uncharacterized membrane protein YphA (DoxX/SURF4 family)